MPEGKGLFGIGGTGRDILGTLGDAFLLQAGQKPLYAPQRERERIGEALQGFDTDPLAAIQRLARAGYGDQAQELYKTYTGNQNQAAKTAADVALAEEKRRTEREKGYGIIGSMVGTITPENYSQVKDLITKYATERQLDLPPLPESYDETSINSLRRVGVEPYQGLRLDQYGRQIENEEQYRARVRTETERHNRRTEDISSEKGTDLSQYRTESLQRRDRSLDQADEKIEIQRANSNKRGGGYPTKPPRQKGDRIRGSNGQIYVSHDGKRWVKER